MSLKRQRRAGSRDARGKRSLARNGNNSGVTSGLAHVSQLFVFRLNYFNYSTSFFV
ncbi:hypothetical protein ABIC37_000559 [Priestia megaterium]|uniref:hypothetical protein n=1 Tax=Priestia megaterium TaxID=1404 RepID=UPI0015D0B434|nr:hypothetical protein [Priestia megaterium]